jgi:hypothetical protein
MKCRLSVVALVLFLVATGDARAANDKPYEAIDQHALRSRSYCDVPQRSEKGRDDAYPIQ